MTTMDRKELLFKKYMQWSIFVSLKSFFASNKAVSKRVQKLMEKL